VKWHRQQNDPHLAAAYLQIRESIWWKRRELLDRLECNLVSDADHVTPVLATFCSFPQLAQALAHSPCCPQCRLMPGRIIRRPTTAELESRVQQEVKKGVRRLTESHCLAAIRQYAKELGETCPPFLREVIATLTRKDEEAFLHLLSEEAVVHLRRALAPQRQVSRRVSDLHPRLTGKTLSKRSAMKEIEIWLDGPDALRPDDQVRFD